MDSVKFLADAQNISALSSPDTNKVRGLANQRQQPTLVPPARQVRLDSYKWGPEEMRPGARNAAIANSFSEERFETPNLTKRRTVQGQLPALRK